MPNVSSGKYIVDKIRQGGFAPREIETDQILQRFINQIAPEQKISWGDPNNEHKGYIGLSALETESFIYQILGEQTTISINSSLFSKMCGHSDDIGLSPTVQRRMHDSGIVLFDILFPEGDYISNNILETTTSGANMLIDKVMIPFVTYVQENGGVIPNEVPQHVRNGMKEVFQETSKSQPIGDLNLESMIDYTLYDVLGMNDAERMERCLTLVDILSHPMHKERLDDTEYREAVDKCFRKEFEPPTKRLECLLNGVSGQIYMNDFDFKEMTPDKITNKLKMAFKIYTAHDRDNTRIQPDETGYRTEMVSVGKRLGLDYTGNKLDTAMNSFATHMSRVMRQAGKIPDEQYLKYVACLHARFVMIHPFGDSNGRIGRDIVNMMLSGIGKNFVVPKEQKQAYLDKMEGMHSGLFDEVGYWPYMEALVTSPERVGKYEMKHCGQLVDFMKSCNTIPLGQERKNNKSMNFLRRMRDKFER